jgi:hypothetical protein
VGEQSSIAGGGRDIATSHNMRDVMRMAVAWYGTGIGGDGGSGGKTTTAQKATAAAAATVTATIPRGGSAGYLLGQVSLMTWVVGEAASQPTVGGRGRFLGGGPCAVWD